MNDIQKDLESMKLFKDGIERIHQINKNKVKVIPFGK